MVSNDGRIFNEMNVVNLQPQILQMSVSKINKKNTLKFIYQLI